MDRLRGFGRAVRKNRRLAIGLGLFILIVLIGVLHAPIVDAIGKGQDPMAVGFGQRWLRPSADHPLGTDQVGRDIAAMTVSGLWTSLKIGAIGGVLSTAIGIVVAFFAAYRGGWLDALLATTTDLFLVIPTLPLLIAYSGFSSHISLLQVSVILAVFSWAGAARTIRSHVLSLRTRTYVDLAKVTKANSIEIVLTELVPNMLPYIALGLALAVINTIFALVGLELIGLGPSGIQDLGLLINSAVQNGALSLGAWPMFAAPIVLLTGIFFALNLINVGLDEAFNPRLRKVAGG
jgi:peptide/nickel transport system permease protein